MDDPIVRLAAVLGAVAVVFGVKWVNSRRSNRGRAIASTGLAPGIYLFTSTTCGDCEVARNRLADREFIDVAWEERPEEFERLGVTDVPSTLVVAKDGSGIWRPGGRV